MNAPKLPIYQDRWWRILRVSFVMYVLSYIDRTNIAMTIPAKRVVFMRASLLALAIRTPERR